MKPADQHQHFFRPHDACILRECNGLVVECLTEDQVATGLSLTVVTALCP